MNDIKRISKAKMELKMMLHKMMVAKSHQESMAWAERAHDKEIDLEALEEELRICNPIWSDSGRIPHGEEREK